MQHTAHEARSRRLKRNDSVVSIASTSFNTEKQLRPPGMGSSVILKHTQTPRCESFSTIASGVLPQLQLSSRQKLSTPSSARCSSVCVTRPKDCPETLPETGLGSSNLTMKRSSMSCTAFTPYASKSNTSFYQPLRIDADFFKSYSTYRKIMEKAVSISNGMREKVNKIAQVEEEQRILSSLKHSYQTHKPLDSSFSFRNDRMERPRSSDWLGKSGSLFCETKERSSVNEYNSGIMTNQHEQHTLNAQVTEKCQKLDKLRAYQRTILLSDEMNLDRNVSFTSRAESHSATKISPPLRNDFLAGVQEAYNALEAVNPNRDTHNLQPPPSTFSVYALFMTIEKLGNSLEALVEATDEICVREFFKQRDEVDLYPQIKQLHAHLKHAEECFQIGMRYLLQFEAGDRALLEYGALEVNSLREQFLIQKELLTSQEQKEKIAEESRNGLQNRLQLLNQRFELWQELLLASSNKTIDCASSGHSFDAEPKSTPNLPVHDRLVSDVSEEIMTRIEGSLTTSVCDSRTRSRCNSETTMSNDGPNGSCEQIHTSQATQKDESLDTASDLVPDTSRARSGPNSYLSFDFAAVQGVDASRSGSQYDTDEDAMERRLAARWGNPHILKRVAYERVERVLLPQVSPERFATAHDAFSEAPLKSDGLLTENTLPGFRVSFHGQIPAEWQPNKVEGQKPGVGDKSSKPTTRYASTVSMRDLTRRRSLRYRNISTVQVGGVEATMHSRLVTLLRSMLRSIPVGGSNSQDNLVNELTGESDDLRGKAPSSHLTETKLDELAAGELNEASNEVVASSRGVIELDFSNPQDARFKVRESIDKLVKHLTEPLLPKKFSEL